MQNWSHAERLMALDEVVSLCEPTQVRHVMSVIEPQFQRDFIYLLPKEVSFYLIGKENSFKLNIAELRCKRL